ncbi:hypothetical protein I4F81_012860 [Pyropia yezoensis]|uniref:Uncharacterized protein n=1 Tax=Pyropia yezoensis TaxID=2788 RepID=A0ACC3CK97_PYRYE|nr:hypothetical protein I4F81_012860 [Neopyropia yezoensis]
MAFAPPIPVPFGAAIPTVAPRRCLRLWRRSASLPARPAPPRAGGPVASTGVSMTEPSPAVVLLPGMDGTALLGGQFRSALDPSISLVEASYPCNELLDTAQLASGVVPTFAAQAREMHPTGRYVVVAQSFSGHGPPEWMFRAQPPPEIVARALLGGGDPAAVDLAREVQAAVATVSPAALRHRARLCLTAESSHLWADRGLFSPRSVPLLYLAGAADVVVANTDHASDMRAARRDVPWVRVAGAPHLALQAAPVATAAVVERFVATCAAGLAVGAA